MASKFDDSDFIAADFPVTAKTSYGGGAPAFSNTSSMNRPPTREEIEAKVSETHVKLAELKRAQEELERERSSLEEARRRRSEFHHGRDEMLQHLTRGIGLLSEAEFAARRDSEQMTKTLGDLKETLGKVQGIAEESWTAENWNTELTRALTILENARMEWNSALLKWNVLNGPAAVAAASQQSGPSGSPAASPQEQSFLQMCKFGLAVSWPVGLAVLIGLTGIALVLLTRR